MAIRAVSRGPRASRARRARRPHPDRLSHLGRDYGCCAQLDGTPVRWRCVDRHCAWACAHAIHRHL